MSNMKGKNNPFKIGDSVLIKKPRIPYPTKAGWHFGIPEDKWNLIIKKEHKVTGLSDWDGLPAIILEEQINYCWPIECATLVKASSDANIKKACDCPDIFIRGCQNRKAHV